MRPADWLALRRKVLGLPGGRALLTALSWLYGGLMLARRALYAASILPSRRLPVRTICFGNITTGGTGKSMAVLLAARDLRERRQKVAILSRGYGAARRQRGVRVLLDGQGVSWQEVGDEPWMMHNALQGLDVPILVSPDRYRAGIEALEYYNPDVLVLDDGYQHLKLRRDLDVVFVNATNPFGGGGVLPLGDLREPMSGLSRAGLFVITHCELAQGAALEELRAVLRRHNPSAPVVEAAHRPEYVFDLKFQRRRRLAFLEGKPVATFCAIGDPASFEAQVRTLGAQTVQCWRYPDHHPYTLEELRSIENVRSGAAVVTTFKDATRLPPGWEAVLAGEVLLLGVAMELRGGAEHWEAALSGRL